MRFSLAFWRNDRREIAASSAASLHSAGIPTLRQTLPIIESELARARRYQYPLAVVLLSLEPSVPAGTISFGNGNGNGGANGHYNNGAGDSRVPAEMADIVLGWILQETLRDSDVLAFLATQGFYLLVLTQTDGPQSQQMMARLQQLVKQRLRCDLRTGIAEFPKDGWILDDLMAAAHSGLERYNAEFLPSTGAKEAALDSGRTAVSE